LYLAGATGSNGFAYSVDSFYNTLLNFGFNDFTVYHQTFAATHNEVALDKNRSALEVLFP